jgi:serine/threonine-protein kinase
LTDIPSRADAATRYREAKGIACAALERAPGERQQVIDAACGADPDLRREVEWLIAAAEDSEADGVPGALRKATAELAAQADLSIEAPLPRNYRLLEPLGEGGMGVVFLAERTDGDLCQRVAVKLLHPQGGQDARLASRFASERRILAALAHPNIAHLIDAGFTREGRPFLAMDYVDGERIDVWCDEHALALRARVRLFLKVCAAVEHAHRHLVIHRDIKPANILVDAGGEPKLLDFGIARLLDDESPAQATQTGSHALTLAYASPEQIEGQPLNTATDVYSLGVVLYELVAGERPFDGLESAHHLSNAIVSGEITPPGKRRRQRRRDAHAQGGTPARSSGLAPSQRAGSRQRVPGDIDAIVLKALRREPGLRYASAADLAADLERFLESRPVLARRGHWPYRARRLAWRWRWALAAALVFLVLLGVFVTEREAQLEQVARERDRAEALVGFMNDLFENADSLRSRGNQVTVREMLDRGARELQSRHDLSPAQRSSMLFAMGRAYNALGLGQEALPLLESARTLLGPDDSSPAERAAVLAELAAAHSTGRDTAASIADDEAAIALWREAPGDHADEIARLGIRVLHNHIDLLDIPLAESRRRLLDIVAALEARTPPPQALLMHAYAALAMAGGDLHAGHAIGYAERAVAIAEHLYGSDDPRILSSRSVRAMVVAMHGDDGGRAIALYRALVKDYQRLVGPGLGLAGVLNNLGITLSRAGRIDEGIAVYRRAADMALAAAGPAEPSYLLAVANLAGLENQAGDAREAQRQIRAILPTLAAQAQSGPMENHATYAAALGTLGASLARLGRNEDAWRSYAEAGREIAAVDPETHRETRREILGGLAASLEALGRGDEAARVRRQRDALGPSRTRTAQEHSAVEPGAPPR